MVSTRSPQRFCLPRMVHHDIWNYDNPNPPKVLDVTVNGEPSPIVVKTTKQGWVSVFNRENLRQ